MKTLNFYHQKRRDGGVRTGVDSNGERVLELFTRGRMPLDSALEWFVDVRCRGRQLPSDPEGIRSWLLQHSEEIQSELETMAKELTAGIDRGWPFVKEIGARSNGVSIKIACSAARRLDAREIARILLNLKKEWPTLIEALPAYSAEKAA